MMDKAFIAALWFVPKNALSRLAGAASRLQAPGPIRSAAIRAFASRYGVNLDECEDLSSFPTFGDFFTRRLKHGVRVIAPGERVVVSPVDGAVSEVGVAEAGRLVQAKGLDYGLAELLADRDLALRFEGGAYATLYLAPRDYHRIHFPLGGQIIGYRYVPGSLWPVNPLSVRNVRRLFCVNERLVTVIRTPLGECAIVAVGATIVGRIHAFYDASIQPTNLRARKPRRHTYGDPIPVHKGAELGAFELGSTVIVLFEKGRVALDPGLAPGALVRVGQAMGGPL